MTTTATQTEATNATTDAATSYRAAGYALCRVELGDKNPKKAGWTGSSAEPHHFRKGGSIGIMTGFLSDGGRDNHSLVCVDLDDANALARADNHLPATAMMEGRASKTNAHRYFLIPNESIPADQVASGNAAAAAAQALGRHSGPKTRQFSGADKTRLIDFLGTGAQAVAPPSIHESGEVREWAGGEMGQPAVIDYADLMEAVASLATACGWQPKESRPNPFQQSKHAAPLPGCKTDAADESRQPLTLNGEVLTLDERVKRFNIYSPAIPDDELSRSGKGGHSTFFRHLSIAANDFAVRCPKALMSLASAYNERLPADDRWSQSEIEHKVQDVLSKPPDPAHPLGCKLSFVPMAWDDPKRLAQTFSNHHTAKFLKGNPYLFKIETGCYRPISDSDLTSRVRDVIQAEANREYRRQVAAWEKSGAEIADGGDEKAKSKHAKGKPKVAPKVTRALVADAEQAIRAAGRLPDETDPSAGTPGKLVVANGILDLRRRTLAPHSPDDFTLTAIPTVFDPAAQCPTWLAFVKDVTEGDGERAAVLQETFGACLDVHLPTKFFSLLVGGGNNGKSVALAVLRFVLGECNVSAVPLDDLTGNRFASHALLGKLANVVGDQGYFDSSDEGRLKQMTGGDLVSFEQKNKDAVAGVNRAKFLFASNSPPSFGDKTIAIWNRLQMVPFTWNCPPDKKNPGMITKTFWAAELPGILNWMLDGLDRLRENRGFSDCRECKRAAGEMRADSNPLAEFLSERYEQDADGFETTSSLLTNYETWAAHNGYTQKVNGKTLRTIMKGVFPQADITKRLAPLLPGTPRDSHRQQERGYCGIRQK